MIKFKDYLTKCLEDPEIRKYWEEGLKELGIVEGDLSLSSEINDNQKIDKAEFEKTKKYMKDCMKQTGRN